VQAGAWEAFHEQHRRAQFFKPRRYLLLEFPRLSAQPLTLLEVGCGSGSSALPVLLRNPQARVLACDFAAAAVRAAREAAAHAGIPSSRFLAFCADPAQGSAAEFQDAVQQAAAAAGWAPLGALDAVLAVFVLSAVPPAALPQLLANVASTLRPGGALLVRDYGIHDLPMRRFAPSAARGRHLFQRADGTLACFFDKQELVECVIQGAATAGVQLLCDDAQWCCVSVRNRAKALEMRRVFVHAQFSRAV
jgi:methyltransferase-like protein 6